jgi:hypothetical protein
VGTSVTQLDRTTQHNAARVEQSAAVAASMGQQAPALAESEALFRNAQAKSSPELQGGSRRSFVDPIQTPVATYPVW